MHALSSTHQNEKLLNRPLVKNQSTKKTLKNAPPSYIFLHIYANFWVKIQNNEHYRNSGLFEIRQIDT